MNHCDPLWHCLWFSRNRSRRGKTQFLRRKVLVPITTQVLYKVDQKVDNGECDLIRKLLIQRVRTMGQRTCQVGKIRECTNKMKEEILIEKSEIGQFSKNFFFFSWYKFDPTGHGWCASHEYKRHLCRQRRWHYLWGKTLKIPFLCPRKRNKLRIHT